MHVLLGGYEQSKFGGYKALDNKTSNGNPWVWRWCCDWVYIQPAGSEGNIIQKTLISAYMTILCIYGNCIFSMEYKYRKVILQCLLWKEFTL